MTKPTTERIHYDDDPAATAAEVWLRTGLGMATMNIRLPSNPRTAVTRAFRAGWIQGQAAAKAEDG
jgi:hypothetical protein